MSTPQVIQTDAEQQLQPMEVSSEPTDVVLAAIDSAMSFYRENVSLLDELNSGQFKLENVPVNFSAAKAKMAELRDFMAACPRTYEPMHLDVASKAAEDGQYWARHLDQHKDAAELFSPAVQSTLAKLQLEAEFLASQIALLKVERSIRILELTFNKEEKQPSQVATIGYLFRELPEEWRRVVEQHSPVSALGLYLAEIYRQHAFISKTEQAWKEYLDVNYLDRVPHGSSVLKDVVFDQLHPL